MTSAESALKSTTHATARPPDGSHFDVIVIGSGIGGLVTATQLAAKGLNPLVLERYLIPGGSAGYFDRDGYRFDVGASMIFGFGHQGTTNLLTRALDAVGQALETVPDPVQVHYHLPNDLSVRVHRDYEQFLAELGDRFPHERAGIRRFYDACWNVFNCLNRIELLSLEEPRYVARVFWQHPLACLGLARHLPFNVGRLACKHLRDPELLRFIDMECYCWSVVPAAKTPLINAGMVFSDRHYGGVNYPKGGVGTIAQALVKGLEAHDGKIQYRSRVTRILTKHGRAVGVQLATGETYRAKRVVSNATRWDTFGNLLGDQTLPSPEAAMAKPISALPQFLEPAFRGRRRCDSGGQRLPPHPAGRLGPTSKIPTERYSSQSRPCWIPAWLPPTATSSTPLPPVGCNDWDILTPTQYQVQKQARADQVITQTRAPLSQA
jgi:prolycopene isomerase